MPHTRNKKKKALAQAESQTTKQVHTRRQQIPSADGWTHVLDTPRRRPQLEAAGTSFPTGDFERGGVWYVDRTGEEMRADLGYFGERWGEGGRGVLVRRLGIGIDGDLAEDSGTVADGEGIVADRERRRGEWRRKEVGNVVVLGLGSLQNARREGRRASWMQLVALRSLVGIIGGDKEKEMEITFQDPQFTDLDKEFLTSLGYTVLDDPQAFDKITEESLVYAIHCYADVYQTVSRGRRPAVIVGTDVDNFGRFNTSEKAEAIARDLREMVDGCEEIGFPQVRHDFSDTKIYWRLVEGKGEENGKGLTGYAHDGEDSELTAGPAKDLEVPAASTKELGKLSLDQESPNLEADLAKDPEKQTIDAEPVEVAVEKEK